MIGRLKGNILEKQAPELLIDVQGVGYEVLAPMTTFYDLPATGEVSLYTHLVVREDAQQLYGFSQAGERTLFRQLIKINGVGPKLALAILSSIDSAEFVHSVEYGDVNRLVKIPGIGKKTAERLLIEMKDRIGDLDVGVTTKIPDGKKEAMPSSAGIFQESESALIALGYKPQQAAQMIAAVKDEGFEQSEDLIRAALKRMA